MRAPLPAAAVLFGLLAAPPFLAGADPTETGPEAMAVIDSRFAAARATGSFLLYDRNEDRYVRYRPERCRQGFLPASTFKIFNSLVGLETGVIADEDFVIPWDGVERRIASWNEDQDLRTAIRRSTVPYFQELARRAGEERMRFYLERENYGNGDLSAGIDRFWLEGGFRVSQEDQIEFLKKLYSGELAFSRRSMEIVKKIIVLRETADYRLRGKTGWTWQGELEIGWLVGWVERDDNVFFFATNLESRDENFAMGSARKTVTYGILEDLGIL